jgi:hypothetical protein
MIKLFRNIRQNLLNEGKTTKYFKYAIGEIVLVVIGILIALSINNWNENRKQKETTYNIYQIIKEDITSDIIEINAFVEDYESIRKPAFEVVIYKNPSKEEYFKHPEYMTVLNGFEDFIINQRGFELLKNLPTNGAVDKQNLTSKINQFYNQHLVEINTAIAEMSRELTNNLSEYKQLPWFTSFYINKETDEVIDFMIDNTLQKNRIAIYFLEYNIYVEELKQFKANGETIINQINTLN